MARSRDPDNRTSPISDERAEGSGGKRKTLAGAQNYSAERVIIRPSLAIETAVPPSEVETPERTKPDVTDMNRADGTLALCALGANHKRLALAIGILASVTTIPALAQPKVETVVTHGKI
jgi:hypothetical protein